MSFGVILVYAILIFVIVFFIHKFLAKYKSLDIGAFTTIVGGLKAGKTGLSVYLLVREYKRILRRVKFANFWRRIFNKDLLELPLPYSNMPIDMPYVQMTEDLLLRNKRMRFKSISMLDDVSLLVDSMSWKDNDLNEHLLQYNKLFGHMTHGGKMIINTQSLKDLHFSFDRVTSRYYYIDHINWHFPFFAVVYLLELIYSADGSITFAQTKDSSELLKKVIVPKWYFKKYDPYCYSAMTDNLPVEDTLVRPKSLKLDKPLSFKDSLANAKLKKKLKGGSDNAK